MVLPAPPLRFGPSRPLAGKQAEPRRARGSLKPTARRATQRKAEAQKRSQFALPRKFVLFALPRRTCAPGMAGRPSPRKVGPSSRSTPLPRRAGARAAVKTAKRPQAPARLTPSRQTLARKASQTLSRKRSLREVFDGSISEAQHLERHAGYKGFCIRCDVQKRPKVYEACSLYEGRSWLARGVSRGLWGLGCRICAGFAATGGRCDDARYSKFANYEMRPSSGWRARESIQLHSMSASHRLACGIRKKESGRTRSLSGLRHSLWRARSVSQLKGHARLLRPRLMPG